MKKILCCLMLVLFASSAWAIDIDFDTEEQEPVRLGIMNFTSKVYNVPDGMAAGISEFFATVLYKADNIKLFERSRLADIASELKLGMSGLVDPTSAAAIGKIAGLQYILLGSITNLSHGASGGVVPVPFVAFAVNTQKAKAELDVRVIDVETSEIVFAGRETGESSKSSTGLFTSWFGVSDVGFDGIEADAILNATVKLAPAIQKAITGRDTLTSQLEKELKKASKSSKTSSKTKSTSKKGKK